MKYVPVVLADPFGQPTVATRVGAVVAPGPLPAVRQVKFAVSFEAVSTYAVGDRARLPFRVSANYGTPRIAKVVVGVAHSW